MLSEYVMDEIDRADYIICRFCAEDFDTTNVYEMLKLADSKGKPIFLLKQGGFELPPYIEKYDIRMVADFEGLPGGESFMEAKSEVLDCIREAHGMGLNVKGTDGENLFDPDYVNNPEQNENDRKGFEKLLMNRG